MKGKGTVNGLVVVGLLLALGVGGGMPAADAADFDGDRFADLAIGVISEDVGSTLHAGAVNVLYGSAAVGLTADDDQIWDEDDTAHEDAEEGDNFGEALAAGDFDGDGRVDLAVGVPYEAIGTADNAGAVHILYGSPGDGLDPLDDQVWFQGNGIQETPEANDSFGYALAAGDFDGDGYTDLAIGASGEDIESGPSPIYEAGVVQVLYGSPDGLSADGNQRWDQSVLAGGEEPFNSEYLGEALASGDFNGDGRDDLAVGVPYEEAGGIDDTGIVHVLYGAAGGLGGGLEDQIWWPGVGTGDRYAEEDDYFGLALTTGDFNGDGHDDLVVGVPYEDVGTTVDAGAAHLFYGSAAGLVSAGNRWYSEAALGRSAAKDEHWGRALTAGDLDGDGRDDLAVGVPGQDYATNADAGTVLVLPGTASGPSDTQYQVWCQGAAYSLADTPEASDRFGWALAAGNFNGDHYADLVVGVPYEDVSTIADAGAVHVLYGSADGLTGDGDQFWHQGLAEIEGTAEEGDEFGYSLAAIPRLRFTVMLPVVLKNR